MNDPITEELISLNTAIDKKKYLEKIHHENAIAPKNLPGILKETNLKKVGTYLELFGYPKISEVGQRAANTPWLIIKEDRSEDELKIKRKYFPMFFSALLNEDISYMQMSMYLNRFYERKFGEHYNGQEITSSKEEITNLIGLLKLETSMN